MVARKQGAKFGQMDCGTAQFDQRFIRPTGYPSAIPSVQRDFGGQNVSSAIAACKAVTASLASPQISNVDAATVRVLMAERVLNRIAARGRGDRHQARDDNLSLL
jgi:hypothetical protein